MVKVKASLWQEMDHVKTNISKEVTQKRDLIAEKRKILAKLKRKLNEQKEKQIKESIARPIRVSRFVDRNLFEFRIIFLFLFAGKFGQETEIGVQEAHKSTDFQSPSPHQHPL